MKKIAIAVAAAVAAAGACAAQVEVYGLIDMGLMYNNVSSAIDGSSDEFKMTSGSSSGSRFGFRGKEDLGNGWAVSFNLQNGFSADTGALGYDSRLFGREAIMSLEGPMGTVSFGRAGALTAGAGTYDVFMAMVDTMDCGWDGAIAWGNFSTDRKRFDNMVSYASPKMAGFTGYAQYSFGTDAKNDLDDGDSNGRDTQRYAALGLTYENGPLSAVIIWDSVMHQHTHGIADVGDSTAVSFGAAYDFEVAKVFASAQIIEGTRVVFDNKLGEGNNADGFTVHLGTAIPLPCGTLKLAAYYGKLQLSETSGEAKDYNFTITHEYPFSKRTTLYTGLGYKVVDWDRTVAGTDGKQLDDEKMFTATVGLIHKF